MPALNGYAGLALLWGLTSVSCVHGAPSPSASAPAAASGPASRPHAVETAAASPQASSVKRTLVAQAELASMPGFESRLYYIEYPPNVEAPLHLHTEQTVGYVLDGRFESAFGDTPLTTTQTGQGFVEVPGQPHRFRNPDPARMLRFVIAGTFRKDEQLFEPLSGTPSFPAGQATAVRPINSESPAVGATPSVQRHLLAQHAIATMPGMESRIYLMEFPPGASSAAHIHTAQGIGYVLEGSFESAFGDQPATIKRAGDGFVDAPGQVHHFRNPDPQHWLRFVFAGTFREQEALFQVVPPAPN